MTWQEATTFKAPSDLLYHIAWQGKGPSLLLLHGFTGHMGTLGDLTSLLADHFRILGVDLPGHGQAIPVPGQQVTFMDVIKDLHTLLAEVSPAGIHCVGYSMGGRIGLALACQPTTPLHSLSAIGASPGLALARERAVRQLWDLDLMAFMQHTPPVVFQHYWQRLPLFGSAAHPVTAPTPQQQRGWSRALAFLGTGFQPSFWSELPHATIPMQFIAGQQDGKYTDIATRMCDLVPNGTQSLIPDAGHRVHLEAPHAVALQITRFIHNL